MLTQLYDSCCVGFACVTPVYIYGIAVRANREMCILASFISGFAHSLLPKIVNQIFQTNGKTDKAIKARAFKISLITSTIVEAAAIVAFRRLNLIGITGVFVLTGAVLLRVTYSFYNKI